MRRLIPVLAAALSFGLFIMACDSGLTGTKTQPTATSETAHQGPPNKAITQHQLAEVRRATARYQDLSKAKADGYKLFSPFVPFMGFHYLHESYINEDGSSALDHDLNRKKPEILVYSDKVEGNSGQFAPHDEGFAAVEYAIPKGDEEDPPQDAVALFNNADAHDWHVHPNHHEVGLSHDWTLHGECHYESGAGILLAEKPNGDFVLLTPAPPVKEEVGYWNGNVEPDQCPNDLGTSLRVVHGKLWTLHAWIWAENPEGVFHPTNPTVSP